MENYQRIYQMLHSFRIGVVVVAAAMLSACVYTRSDYVASDATPSTNVRQSGAISILEGDVKDRPYRELGKISAFGRSVNLLSSDPTRADVDEALRVEAAKHGADAVIKVTYHSERTGLASRGKMIGEGIAIAYTSK
jgi:hypothetical protein